MALLTDVVWSHAGFDDLKKYCHKNNDFIRDVSQLFQERAKLEQIYAEGLTKIASKAKKICGDTIGTLRQCWEDFASQTESEAYIHKGLGNDMLEEISKPFKVFADQQKEARKPAEQAVEKSLKLFMDKRTKESQAKKIAFMKSKEAENLTIQLESARGKAITDKELSKLDSKCKKAEESVTKADDEYIAKLIEAERSRLNLDSSIESSTQTLQKLEEDRIINFKNLLTAYTKLLINSIPKLQENFTILDSKTQNINYDSDIKTIIDTRGTKREPGEQILFSCYEEDMNNPMDNTRRRLALEMKYKRLEEYLHAEKKARKGLSRLNTVYSDNPNFSTLSAQQDVGFQLSHAASVINLIDASIYRMQSAISSIGYNCPTSCRLSSYIEERKDKQGMYHCVLRAPLDLINDVSDDNVSYGSTDYQSSVNPIYRTEYDDDSDDFDDVDPDFEEVVDASAAPEAYDVVEFPICVENLEIADATIKEFENLTGTKYVIYRKKAGFCSKEFDLLSHKVLFEDKQSKIKQIAFDGNPFIINSMQQMDCVHGRDWNLSSKIKRKEEADRDVNSLKKRRISGRTKKMDCPAKIFMRDVIFFPKYKINANTEWKKKMAVGKLKKEWREDKSNVLYDRKVYIFYDYNHIGHVIGGEAPQTATKTDNEEVHPTPTNIDNPEVTQTKIDNDEAHPTPTNIGNVEVTQTKIDNDEVTLIKMDNDELCS